MQVSTDPLTPCAWASVYRSIVMLLVVDRAVGRVGAVAVLIQSACIHFEKTEGDVVGEQVFLSVDELATPGV